MGQSDSVSLTAIAW